MSEDKLFCLTLDLENDWYFDEPGYDHLTFDYIGDFIELISDLDIPISTFVVGQTLERYPEVIHELEEKLDIEFHLHSYSHDTTKTYDFRQEIQQGIQAFEDYFGGPPQGYRAPQGNIGSHEFPILESEGFQFDSSVFPSYRPGIYNNLSSPLQPYYPDEVDSLLEIPVGALPRIRVPTGHNYFKLLGSPLMKLFKHYPLPDILVYNIHLHDLFKTKSHDNLPAVKRFIFNRNIENSVDMLNRNMSVLRTRGYQPVKISQIYDRCH